MEYEYYKLILILHTNPEVIMTLSTKETSVINLFRKKHVAPLDSIQTEVQVSRNTVLRAITTKLG